MAYSPITSVFNDAYIAEVYESYRSDPTSVEESWRQFFRMAEGLSGVVQPQPGGQEQPQASSDPALLRKTAGAAALVHAIRIFGHLAVSLDPLGSPPLGAQELTPEFHGITEADLQQVPAAALGFDPRRFGTGADVIAMLRRRYSGRIGLEFAHLDREEERQWFRQMLRAEELTRPLTPDEKKWLLQRLSEVDGLERFLGRAFQGKKRFSIEGTDALVPMLDVAIAESARMGVREVVVGMAHRGRLNVLTHVMGKPHATLFAEFEGRHADTNAESDTGDVKYHMGYQGRREVPGAGEVQLILVPNPSHLEFVNPVIAGVARAHRRGASAAQAPQNVDPKTVVLTVAVHGDAAFIGEGVVAEALNMSRLRGYEVGGTLHIIVNNQVGFTTDPYDARSTYYASDLAHGFDVPVVHVNGDDAEACVAAVRIAVAFRNAFKKDILIDLVGYRRHGHNETDEPSFTQPTLYQKIKAHPTPREVWGARLVKEGVLAEADVQGIERAVAERLQKVLDDMHAETDDHSHAEADASPEGAPAPPPPQVQTAVPAETLVALNERLLAWPQTLKVNQRLARTLERRRAALQVRSREELLADKNATGIDWGHAEALAFASLLVEGESVRITGQDVERGTFSHRQAVLRDQETGERFVPLQNLPDAKGTFEIYNSPLSETAVMGFEYGYSVAAPDALVLWEAQFGDFHNVAQPIIDQFLAADRAKWGQDSGLVLLLPHGYEGQGPEHSSARLERFLQLCAEGNMVVAYPSTPAQYFHILRRQATRDHQRPLVLMQPKSLLRLKEASSVLADLAGGSTFQPVIDDATAAQRRDAVRRVVFCTAKMFYDVDDARAKADAEQASRVAVVRVDELYPWPRAEIERVLNLYPAVEEVVWAQEEPQNMGAWTYAAPRLRVSTGNALPIRYVGRPERASPAEGYEATHKVEQKRIVDEVLSVPSGPKGRAPKQAAAQGD
jgi:2-oxoglutarate dehydrogenase E1 component